MERKLDLRVQKTYRLLHLAFTELLKEKTFEDITVGELCNKAMIRKNTFYAHFEDKYGYFNFYLSELREEFKHNVSQNINIVTPTDYSQMLLHEMFQFAHSHKQIFYHLKDSTRMSFLYQAMEEQISSEIYNTLINTCKNNPVPDLKLVATFYAGGIINVMNWWLNNPTELEEETISQKLIKLAPLPHDFT